MNDVKKLPILLVDDDEPTRNLLRALTIRYGFGSEIATNGQEAIDLLEEHDYSAIILDLMMPAVGGHHVIAYLEERNRRIPVIVCTAAGRSVSTGFDPNVVKAVVRKPFDIEQLIALLKQLTGAAAP